MMANTHHQVASFLPRSCSRSIAINKRSRPDYGSGVYDDETNIMRDTNTSLHQQQQQEQQQEGREGNEMYDYATWRMYNRIVDYRRRNNNSSSGHQSHPQQLSSSNQKNRINNSPSSSSSSTSRSTLCFSGKGIISASGDDITSSTYSSGLASSMMYSHDVPLSEYYYPSDDDEYESGGDEIFDLEL